MDIHNKDNNLNYEKNVFFQSKFSFSYSCIFFVFFKYILLLEVWFIE